MPRLILLISCFCAVCYSSAQQRDPFVKFRLGPIASFSQTILNVDDEYLEWIWSDPPGNRFPNQYLSNHGRIGASCELSFPRILRGLAIEGRFEYGKRTFDLTGDFEDGRDLFSLSGNITQKYWAIPLIVSYALPLGGQDIVLGFGVNYEIIPPDEPHIDFAHYRDDSLEGFGDGYLYDDMFSRPGLVFTLGLLRDISFLRLGPVATVSINPSVVDYVITLEPENNISWTIGVKVTNR